jgi:hypothetical protein
MYIITDRQYKRLREVCQDTVVEEIGRQPLKKVSENKQPCCPEGISQK